MKAVAAVALIGSADIGASAPANAESSRRVTLSIEPVLTTESDIDLSRTGVMIDKVRPQSASIGVEVVNGAAWRQR